MTPRAKAPRQRGRATTARPVEPTTAADLLARRTAAGLTLAELGRRVASLDGGSPEAWRVALTDYEAGRKVPTSERVSTILTALDATPERSLQWELLSALRPEVLGEIVGRYGLEMVATELERRAASLRALGDRLGISERKRTR